MTAPVTKKRPRTLAQAVGDRVARKVFEKRGNRSEAHIDEAELAAIVESACSLFYSCLPKQR